MLKKLEKVDNVDSLENILDGTSIGDRYKLAQETVRLIVEAYLETFKNERKISRIKQYLGTCMYTIEILKMIDRNVFVIHNIAPLKEMIAANTPELKSAAVWRLKKSMYKLCIAHDRFLNRFVESILRENKFNPKSITYQKYPTTVITGLMRETLIENFGNDGAVNTAWTKARDPFKLVLDNSVSQSRDAIHSAVRHTFEAQIAPCVKRNSIMSLAQILSNFRDIADNAMTAFGKLPINMNVRSPIELERDAEAINKKFKSEKKIIDEKAREMFEKMDKILKSVFN